MKILQLCKKFPFPVKDGESIAVSNLAKAFAQLGIDVSLLAMNTRKHWVDTSEVSGQLDHYTAIHTIHVDNRIKPLDALGNLFSDKSYHIQRFVDPVFADKLRDILQQGAFDVVQLETLYLAPYIPVIRQYSSALIALRAHNVEHEIWERIAANGNPVKKWYLQTITPRLKKFEVDHLNRYDLVIGITERDVEHFRRLGLRKPATVTPIGLDARDYTGDFSSYRQPLSLSFIGSLDWMPNIEGLDWFLEKVWAPVLGAAFPALEVHIAGRNAPARLQRLRLPRVHVHGEVPDAAQFINQHSVMLAPLLSGGGMRAKILEGMALGKVVLSTRMGLEGIDATDRREVLLADTPEEFVQAIEWCYAQGERLERMGQRAQEFCAEHFDNLEVARRLVQTYRNMMPRRPVRGVVR